MTASGTRLAEVVRIADFEPLARAAMEPGAYDYVASGAADELTLADNEAAWRRRRLMPRVLVDVSRTDATTTLLGEAAAFPLAIAPMAAHGIAHPDGEVATVRAAAAAGIPFTLSTMAMRSIEEVAAAAPDAVRWFQLYVQKDPGKNRSLVERAAAAGYRAIVLTVDMPVLGYRDRDRRSGFSLDVPLGNFANEGERPNHGSHGSHGSHGRRDGFDRLGEQKEVGLTWDDLDTIRSWSDLPLVLKGILTVEDARRAVASSVDAIAVSNHGGRQLDRVPATVDVLAGIVDAVGGDTEIWVDGGVRRGTDIAVALALGARGVLLGRPIVWALAAGGEAGVGQALSIMGEEFENALALLGAPTPSDIRPEHLAP